MDHAARVAFIQAQTVCALAEIEGMKAANRLRQMQGHADAYGEEEFMNVPDRFGIGHNSVVEYLREG